MTPEESSRESITPPPWPAPESAEVRGRGAPSRDELREALPVRPPSRPDERQQTAFPGDPEIEYEKSVIRIPFYLKGRARREARRDADIMVFDAYMRLIRERPIRNGIGLRQFEFYID